MTSDIRTFIAVDISPACISQIALIQSHLKPYDQNIKWVKPENCHITLKFLGKTPVDLLPRIIEIIRQSLQSIQAFEIQTSAVNAFPSLDSPEILWLGVSDDQENLNQLSNLIEDTLKSQGLPKENRPFTAHITFGRTRPTNPQPNINQELNSIKAQPVPILVDHVTLYQSTLSCTGSEYKPIYRWPLKEKAPCI